MRFRSVGISASNIDDYLSRLKEEEDNCIYESILSHIEFISLEKSENIGGLLGPNSLYKLSELKNQRKKRRRGKLLKIHYRKKLYFHHQTSKTNSSNNIL